MDNAFIQRQLQKQGVLQNLFKKQPSDNFLIEVNNLLASKPISDITKLEIDEIASKYSKNIVKNNLDKFQNLYSDYLIFCLKDKSLSQEEIDNLKHLKNILSLYDSQVNKIHNQITGSIFKKSVREVIDDGEITEEEKEFLNNLQKKLMLPDDIVKDITDTIKGSFVQEFLDNAVSDERLSPDEEKKFELICKNLNIEASFSEKTKLQLDKYRLFWAIENAELPEINAPISLTKQEKCYFQTSVEWYEKRTVTQRINYGGPTASIKIMKGVRYRAGSIKLQRVTSEEWKLIDFGTLYLTSKRLIFVGASKNSNITLAKILSFTPYSDGIEISKDTGRPLFLKFSNNSDFFSLILSRLLNE
jgi:hypothetical protein